jgi:hypothetical protein
VHGIRLREHKPGHTPSSRLCRDDLQAVQALRDKGDLDVGLHFTNYR